MSLENQGVFKLVKEVTFGGILTFLSCISSHPDIQILKLLHLAGSNSRVLRDSTISSVVM
jgi:hypothetical protein